MTRRPLFAANWKMHKTPDAARAYCAAFVPDAERICADADVALLVPFVSIEAVGNALAGTKIAYGAQDCYWEPQGAFTGEISAAMLAHMGCTYCIVGHSERRRLFGDTDATVARKVDALLAVGVTPIVCLGETYEEHQTGMTLSRCMQQVSDGIGQLEDEHRTKIVIAYEPIWAIGTGLADTPESAQVTIDCIRRTLGGLEDAPILYGGSMKADNAGAFCAQPDIDGGLVGTASLDPASFLTLIRNGLGGRR